MSNRLLIYVIDLGRVLPWHTSKLSIFITVTSIAVWYGVSVSSCVLYTAIEALSGLCLGIKYQEGIYHSKKRKTRRGSYWQVA